MSMSRHQFSLEKNGVVLKNPQLFSAKLIHLFLCLLFRYVSSQEVNLVALAPFGMKQMQF